MGQLVHAATKTALDGDGNPVPGAVMEIFHTQSEVPAPIYRDFHLTDTVPNPLQADASGAFPTAFLTDGIYRAVIRSPLGAKLNDLDNLEAATRLPQEGIPVEDPLRAFFSTLPELLADTGLAYVPGAGQGGVTPGDTIKVGRKLAYTVLDAATTDIHLETAGGVRVAPLLSECDPVQAEAFGLVAGTGTDQLAAAQMAVDFAWYNGSGVVTFPRGDILLGGTLRVGRSDSGLVSVKLQGAVGAFLGNTRFVHGAGQTRNPMINIVGTRMAEIADIELRGNNPAPGLQTGENYINATYADWITTGCSDDRYAPYAGIALAALNGTDPGAGQSYDFAPYGQDGLPSKVFLSRVRIQNFVAAVVPAPNAGTQGVEDIMLRDCSLVENTFGICTTGSQQRNVVAQNCNILGHFCAFDNITFGSQSGQPVNVRDCNIGKIVHVLQSASDVGQTNISGCYFENIRAIGMIGESSSGAAHSALLQGSNISLSGYDNDGSVANKDTVLHLRIPTKVDSCTINGQALIITSISQRASIENTMFRSQMATPAGQELFGIYTPVGEETRLSVRDCDMRFYSGDTPKYLNDVQEIATLPDRALIARNTREIIDKTSRRRHRITPHPGRRAERNSIPS